MAFATPDDSVENDLNSNGVVENSEDAVFATTMVTTEANNFGIHPRGLHNSGDEGSNGGVVLESEFNVHVEDSDLQKKRKLADLEEGSENTDPDASVSKKPHMDKEVQRQLPDLEKFWSTVDQDPSDFTAWTHLLQYVDQVANMSVAGEAYDAFLQKYPYCYGYWKKYADYARRRGSAAEVQQIFNRGLQAIPLSVDLWIHFVTYIKSTHQDDEALIRSKFEQGIEACGLEFRSDKLWEQYVQWETEVNNWKNAMRVWDQMNRTPTQSLKKHFEKLLEFVNEHEPSEILSDEEYSALCNEIGEESDGMADQEDLVSKLRSKIQQRRNEVFENTMNEIKIRSTYEEGIKRPYFHVKPVEKNQLRNWTEYLEFEIGKGELKRIITLFERCLIACAMYAEYWDKYLQFLQSQDSLDLAKIDEVFMRVTQIHHPKIHKFHLDFAAFHEIQGNLEKASTIYAELLSSTPPSFPVYYRHIHFERRRNNLTKCSELFEKYAKECEDAALSVHLSMKYARFLNRILGSYDKAVEVLKTVLDVDENSRANVLMALVDLGMHTTPIDVELILFAFDHGIRNLDKENKLKFARRKLEFLEDYTHDVKIIQNAEDEVQSILKATKIEEKPESVLNPTKAPNLEVAKKAGPVESQPSAGYDYSDSSNPSYSSQYGQYPQGQYGSSWNSQPPAATGDPNVYGQSYVNQPTSWNSFYA